MAHSDLSPSPRIYFAHYKEYNEHDIVNECTTYAYTINREAGIVSVGAAYFVKRSRNEHWNRKVGNRLALERLYSFDNVHTLHFSPPFNPKTHEQYKRLEWFITCAVRRLGPNTIQDDGFFKQRILTTLSRDTLNNACYIALFLVLLSYYIASLYL